MTKGERLFLALLLPLTLIWLGVALQSPKDKCGLAQMQYAVPTMRTAAGCLIWADDHTWVLLDFVKAEEARVNESAMDAKK